MLLFNAGRVRKNVNLSLTDNTLHGQNDAHMNPETATHTYLTCFFS